MRPAILVPARLAASVEPQALIRTGTAFEAGVFGSVEALRATTAQSLSQAIDQALDDPALATFLAGAKP